MSPGFFICHKRRFYSFVLLAMTQNPAVFNTNFRPIFQSGRWTTALVPMIASVAIAQGAAIYRVEDGTHTKVTNSTANFKGILLEPITAADDDYATSAKLKLCAIPLSPEAEAEFAVGAGTFTQADEGKAVAFNDEVGLAVDTDGTQAVITKCLNSARGRCKFNLAIS